MSDEPTFRDFAAAIMSGEVDRSVTLLEALLGLDTAAAQAATTHFQSQMKSGGPDFMMKAMSMRGAVESGDAERLGDLLRDLFALEGTVRDAALATIRKRYAN